MLDQKTKLYQEIEYPVSSKVALTYSSKNLQVVTFGEESCIGVAAIGIK